MRTPEQIKEYQKQWREKNKKKRAEYAKVYHASWYQKNKEKKLEQNRNWDKNNRTKRIKIHKKYRDNNQKKEILRCKRYREHYPEKVKDSAKRYRKTEKGYFRSYQSGAVRRGYVFQLTYEEFVALLQANCRYCNTEKSMGIDRVDNNVGYILENCVSCCTHCNRMKWAHSQVFFLEHVNKIAKNCGII